MTSPTRRGRPGVTRHAPQMSSREWWRRASAAFVAAVAQDNEIQAREQLRAELRTAGYPADRFIADLAAGHPLQVVLRRHGFESHRPPTSRLETVQPDRNCAAVRAVMAKHDVRPGPDTREDDPR